MEECKNKLDTFLIPKAEKSFRYSIILNAQV